MSQSSKSEGALKKRILKVVSIPGTNFSSYNSQLLVSTGLSSLDTILGGGIPLGTIMVVEEDLYNIAGKTFLKHFISEGISNKHILYVASLEGNPNFIIEQSENIFLNKENNLQKSQIVENEPLKIAWRYQNIALERTVGRSNWKEDRVIPKHIVKNSFTWANCDVITEDKHIQKEDRNSVIENIKNIFNKFQATTDFKQSKYWDLLSDIKTKIEANNLQPSTKLESNMLRLGIDSFLSPFWSDGSSDKENEINIKYALKFMVILKTIIRSSYSVCVITVPSNVQNSTLSRMTNIADFVIKLDSFHGTKLEGDKRFSDYDGRVFIKKIPSINTITLPQPILGDWAYKIKRNLLSFKPLHLPPDISESQPNVGCASSTEKSTCHSSLDF